MTPDQIRDALADAQFQVDHQDNPHGPRTLKYACVLTIDNYLKDANEVLSILKGQGIVLAHEQTLVDRLIRNITVCIKAIGAP